MLECKFGMVPQAEVYLERINRYMLECKLKKRCAVHMIYTELIDTCWNVNSIGTSLALIFSTELIDTCWDVNINITLSEKSINEN